MNIARKLFYLVPAFLFFCFNAAGATLNADFTISSYTKKCQDSSFVFDASTATTYTGSGTLTYAWDFGDTTSGTNAAKQTKKYTHEGKYKVRLIITSSDGLKDTAIKDVEVYPVPKANFTFPTKLCQRTEVAFKDSSLVSSTGYINKYLWTFEPGKTSSSANPIVNLLDAKTYNVKLEIWTDKGCYSSVTKAVTLKPRPDAEFEYTSHCQDSAITFDATQSTGTISSYKWFFPDGTTTTGKTTSKTFPTGGSYTVKLVTYNAASGCDDSLFKSVAVFDNPKMNFEIRNSCNDSAFYIINKTDPQYGENQQMLIYWDINKYPSKFDKINIRTTDYSTTSSSGGVTAWKANQIDTIYHYYKGVGQPNPLGNYKIQILLTTSKGCTNTYTKTIEMRGKPKAAFVASPTCQDSAVQFYDKSTVPTGNGGFVKYWLWYFGDSTAGKPNTSALQNPTHRYKKPGTFKVTLIAATDAGCADTVRNQLVTVYPSPTAFFIVDADCKNRPILFKDTSSVKGGTINAWLWNFGDSTSGSNTSASKNPTHTYSKPGNYTVRLVAYSDRGCSDTNVQQLTILPDAIPGFKFSGACERSLITFSDTSIAPKDRSLSNYEWDFGDGNSDKTNSKVVTHEYSTPGKKTVTLTVSTSEGCPISLSKDVFILPAPKAGFTNTPTCIDKEATFTNTTTIFDPSISMTYKWDFGDIGSGTNNTSTLRNPVHTYKMGGQYTVKLVATSSNGCKDSFSKVVEAATVPKADFSFTNLCNDTAMEFVDASTVNSSVITQRIWYWNDASAPDKNNNKKPTHKFPAAGKYDVSLVTVTVSGCRDSITKTVETYPKPKADFTYTTHCADTAITFVNISTMANGDTVYAHKWNFGDGSPETSEKSPTHLFTKGGGTYNVVLTTYSPRGCTDVMSKMVKVLDRPIPAFSALGTGGNQCATREITFFDESPSGTIVSRIWDFGDTTTSTAVEPTHTYKNAGTYKVKVTGYNANGCDSTIEKDVVIHELPFVKVGWTGGCAGETVLFRDSSKTESGKKKMLIYIPAKGFVKNMPTNGKLVYDGFDASDEGDFDIIYTVTDMPNGSGGDAGCDNTDTFKIHIYPKPVPSFTSDIVCFGDETSLIGASDAAGGAIAVWKWQFKDGTTVTSTSNTITHVFAKPGVDTVTLTVTNIAGCTSTIKSTITTLEKPVASFTMTPNPASIINPTVNFKNTSKNISNFSWDFGDGFVSQDLNPTHKFLSIGKYPITLMVENSAGCRDTLIDTLIVKQDYVIYIPNAVSPNGDKINDQWKPEGEGIEDYELVITNRWGEEMFRTTDFNEYWKCDKNGNGIIVPEGVYIYYIRIVDFEVEDVDIRKGFINVVR